MTLPFMNFSIAGRWNFWFIQSSFFLGVGSKEDPIAIHGNLLVLTAKHIGILRRVKQGV